MICFRSCVIAPIWPRGRTILARYTTCGGVPFSSGIKTSASPYCQLGKNHLDIELRALPEGLVRRFSWAFAKWFAKRTNADLRA